MPSELERTLAAWRKRVLAQDQEAAVRIMAAFGNALTRLQPMIALLDYEIEHMPSPTPAKLFRLERYQILERQLIDEITALAQQTGSSVRGGEAQAIEWGQQAALELVQAAAAEPHEITGSFARVPADAVRDLVGTLSPDSPAGKILESFGTDAATALREAITSGAALGQSPRVVARAMQKTVGMKATRALLISRTEMLRAFRTSTLARYSANGDVLQGWKWVSAHNTRTCAACLAMDQTVFPLTTQFFPAHPACRCAASPVLKPEYAAKRKPPESGDQWLARQSADVQDGILGKQGGAAYRAGEVALGDFVRVDDHPIWGESHRDGGIAWARARAERRRRKEAMRRKPEPPKVEPFTPAKTITEAKRKAKELGLNLIGATPDQLPTVNLINDAASTLARLGYTIEAPIKIVNGTHKSAAALFDIRIGKRGQMQIFTKTTYFDDPAGIAASAGKNGIFAWSDAAGLVRHEMAHYLHGKKKRYNLIHIPLTPDQRDMATRKVSRYAGTVSTEFVAEVFAAGSVGRVFDSEVMDLYRKLGGPEF